VIVEQQEDNEQQSNINANKEEEPLEPLDLLQPSFSLFRPRKPFNAEFEEALLKDLAPNRREKRSLVQKQFQTEDNDDLK